MAGDQDRSPFNSTDVCMLNYRLEIGGVFKDLRLCWCHHSLREAKRPHND